MTHFVISSANIADVDNNLNAQLCDLLFVSNVCTVIMAKGSTVEYIHFSRLHCDPADSALLPSVGPLSCLQINLEPK